MRLYKTSLVGRIFSSRLLLIAAIGCDREQKAHRGKPFPSIRQETGTMKSLSKMTGGIFFITYMSQAAAKPISQTIHIAGTDGSDPEVVDLAFSIKMAETALAIFFVTVVIITYSVLIQRGSFMPTTAMYPQHSIERILAACYLWHGLREAMKLQEEIRTCRGTPSPLRARPVG